ncbi:DUF4492 domain-containing protein [Bacteroides sp. 519]|uniref:DUF4492 domain-containing protein n=1 Tax=Bacteroides sp. 519 TaxID=2302937 RepID=UPI0013D049F8|nr:DUF4492 domain-containing protein [Bacteroides sp. 519]NDV58550.1 DUF4492 domain-containing protein [Bacteroides sp. 519]
MRKTVIKIWEFYIDGFRSMTLGRTLWFIILLKLFIMFFVLKMFFFPNFLNTRPKGMSKEEFVAGELIERTHILDTEK